MAKNFLEGWISEHELAKQLGKSLRALRADRQRRVGLPWAKYGKKVYYRTIAPAAYLESHEIKPVRERRGLPDPMALKTKRRSLVTSGAEGVDQLETVDPSITEIRRGSQAPTAVRSGGAS